MQKTIKFILIFVSLFVYSSLFSDEVFFKNGTSLKGVVIKLNNNQTLDFLMRDNGETYNISYKDILKIKYKNQIGKKKQCIGSYKNGIATITLKNKKVIQSQILIEDNKKYIIIDTKLKVTQKIPKDKIAKLEFKQQKIEKLPKNFLRVQSLIDAKVDVVLQKGNKLSGKVLKHNCETFSILNQKKESKIFYSAIVLIKLQKKEIEKGTKVATLIPGVQQIQLNDYGSGSLTGIIFFSAVGSAISSYNSIIELNIAYRKQNDNFQLMSAFFKGQDPDFSLSDSDEGVLLNFWDSQQKAKINGTIASYSQTFNASVAVAAVTYIFNFVVSKYAIKSSSKKSKLALSQKDKKEEYSIENNTKFIFNYGVENLSKENYYSSSGYEYKYNLGYSYRF